MAKNTGRKVAALVGVASLVVGGLVGGFIFNDNKQVTDLQNQVLELENQPAKIVEVTEEVLVDNGNLDLVLEYLDENLNESDGNVNFNTLDLDDNKIEGLVDRIIFTNEIKAKAVTAVKAEAFNELNHEYVDKHMEYEVKLQKEDLERLKVLDDIVTVNDLDFKDGDANVDVTVNFEQEDEKYTATFDVEFKDGEVDSLKLIGAPEVRL
ncbi:hypothetical protein KAI04_03860 [Candidatus Pacearchaeota archaeon]|nr:hypothetical protein [Candidatus Pacearchaeota archaeon]